jgi:hypothetical protein
MSVPGLVKVISGGQTGVDRVGLEVAKEKGLETGGTAPRGYKTEKGFDVSLKDYGLVEDTSYDYNPRTRANVRDSDGTVIFGNTTSVGSKLTIRLCKDYKRPYLENPSITELRQWLLFNKIAVLNVAGNRLSQNATAAHYARGILMEVL